MIKQQIPNHAVFFSNLDLYTTGRNKMDALYDETCPAKMIEHVRSTVHDTPATTVLQACEWKRGNVEHNIDQLYKLADDAKDILDGALISIVSHPESGLPDDLLDVTIGDVKELGIPLKNWKLSSHGIVVTDVPEASMAYFFGVRPLMALIAVDNREVDSIEELERILRGEDASTSSNGRRGSAPEAGPSGGGTKLFRKLARQASTAANLRLNTRQHLMRTASVLKEQSTVLRFRGVCLQLHEPRTKSSVEQKMANKCVTTPVFAPDPPGRTLAATSQSMTRTPRPPPGFRQLCRWSHLIGTPDPEHPAFDCGPPHARRSDLSAFAIRSRTRSFARRLHASSRLCRHRSVHLPRQFVC